MIDKELQPEIQNLLLNAGFSNKISAIKSCTHGGNNRTYRLETPDGVFAVKKYFREPNDLRDRLASEFAFLTYANAVAPQWVPKVYSQDVAAGIALYEFIDGQPFAAGMLTGQDVMQASEFFCALNHPKRRPAACPRDPANVNTAWTPRTSRGTTYDENDSLPFASESCFSIAEHLDVVAKRIAKLRSVDDATVKPTIENLSLRWETLVNDVMQQADAQNIDIAAILPQEQRCISPSDFGFHNALKMSDGRLKFLDFEYAGWDDPAKMIGDFFAQLAVPVPGEYFDYFTQHSLRGFAHAADLERRAKLLRPIHKIKWCCIALNIFIPVNLARRQFANPDLDVAQLKKTQLAKAEMLLQ